MPRDDWKAKVQMSYPTVRCSKEEDGVFYVKGLPFGPEWGPYGATARCAWKQAFWSMPVEERNKSIED